MATKSELIAALELPEEFTFPEALLGESELLRYAFAGSLYIRGHVTSKEARELTGDNRRDFLEKLSRYGFPAMFESDEEIRRELDE